MKMLLLTMLLLAVLPASAAVYRCEHEGKITYTDKPCASGAAPAQLPAVTSLPPDTNARALAKQYDADTARQNKSQASADTAWLKAHRQDRVQEDAIRKALIEDRVVKGMTREQVQRVLNLPTHIDDQGGPKERWLYQNGRERRTIAFKNGLVSSDSARTSRK